MSSMTFLQIVARAYQEAGLTGTTPVSVLNQTGRAADMVRWALSAHEYIQSLRLDWTFDWAQGTFALVANTDTYDPTSDFGVVGGVREFLKEQTSSYAYPTASGVNARLFLTHTPWEHFRGLLVPATLSAPPIRFSVRPDGDIQYWPKPNVACTAVHEYQRNAQVLAADEDVPRMPAWSHMAIVWKAVMLACTRTKDWSRHDTAEEHFYALHARLLSECTPQMTLGDTLA